MTHERWTEDTGHMECQGCAQYEKEVEALEALVARLDKLVLDQRLQLVAQGAALNLAEQLVEAQRRRKVEVSP